MFLLISVIYFLILNWLQIWLIAHSIIIMVRSTYPKYTMWIAQTSVNLRNINYVLDFHFYALTAQIEFGQIARRQTGNK
jgi:hypothetical protein